MGLVVLHLHLHGLFRGHDLEAGRDADSGGQTIYVHDLARTLADHPELDQVEVVTRRISDLRVAPVYGVSVEPVSPRFRIRRLPFGPPAYLAKETLWPFLDALVDSLELSLRAAPRLPDWIHAHYADAGYVGARLRQRLRLPLVFTAHSLGREKRRRLIQAGHDPGWIERRYQLARRIAAEELALAHSSLVITSTAQEFQRQYGRYLAFRPERARVISPGIDPDLFHPPDGGAAEQSIAALVAAHLHQPERPPLLALCRPDPRKNILALVDGFAGSILLRQRHNLVLALGSALAAPAGGSRASQAWLTGSSAIAASSVSAATDPVAVAVLDRLRQHGLQGRVALLPQLPRAAIPALYRWAASRGGLFVNPALTEPFGLTLLEAAACGLPVVATDDGGPREILARCGNGLLVDVSDPTALGRALEEAGADRLRWHRWSRSGMAAVARHYSWRSHADRYLGALADTLAAPRLIAAAPGSPLPLPAFGSGGPGERSLRSGGGVDAVAG